MRTFTLPQMTQLLFAIRDRLHIIHLFYCRSVTEHLTLERMYKIVQKGTDGLMERLFVNLDNREPLIIIDTSIVEKLKRVNKLDTIEACITFIEIFNEIRSQFKGDLFRNSLYSFIDDIISDLNEQIYMFQLELRNIRVSNMTANRQQLLYHRKRVML